MRIYDIFYNERLLPDFKPSSEKTKQTIQITYIPVVINSLLQ